MCFRADVALNTAHRLRKVTENQELVNEGLEQLTLIKSKQSRAWPIWLLGGVRQTSRLINKHLGKKNMERI